jgi:hypothetical protein
MKNKIKQFDYSNNYLEKSIAKVLGLSTNNMGYSEGNTHYYYWYDVKDMQLITDNISNIKEEICKLEKCNAHVTDYQCEEGKVVLILFKE